MRTYLHRSSDIFNVYDAVRAIEEHWGVVTHIDPADRAAVETIAFKGQLAVYQISHGSIQLIRLLDSDFDGKDEALRGRRVAAHRLPCYLGHTDASRDCLVPRGQRDSRNENGSNSTAGAAEQWESAATAQDAILPCSLATQCNTR